MYSSIVVYYYSLDLSSSSSSWCLAYILTSSGYRLTTSSTVAALDRPISLLNQLRLSMNTSSHLIWNVLSFVITFLLVICPYNLFVHTIVYTYLSIQFGCIYKSFVHTYLSIQPCLFVHTYNISTK